MAIAHIIELHQLAVGNVEGLQHARPLLAVLKGEAGKHYTGIVGPRGVGKTVLLKQLAAGNPSALYLSLDMIDRDADLFEIIKKLHLDYKYTTFLLDEVHFHPRYDETLKKLYDLLDIRVIFTSSVALSLRKSAFDLSRRVLLRGLHPFSLREYLFFKRHLALPPLSLQDVFNREWTPDHLRAGVYFEDYLRGGLMPFALAEPEPLKLLAGILDTIIHKDIPAVARLMVDELDLIRKTVEFVGRSAVDGINYSTLANNLGITKYKAEQYLGLLESAFVLQRIFPQGTNVLKEPKVLMAVPYRLLFRDYREALGGLREDFFAEVMRSSETRIHYLKSTRGAKTPDYIIEGETAGDGTVIEIGGKGKGRSQFKDFETDRKFIFIHGEPTTELQRPLFMLGFLN